MHEHTNQKINVVFESFLPFIRHNMNIAAAATTYINFEPEYISIGFPLKAIAKNITRYSSLEIFPVFSTEIKFGII